MNLPEIRFCRIDDLRTASNIAELVDAYAAEGAVEGWRRAELRWYNYQELEERGLVKAAGAWAGEKLGRLKPNARGPFSRSPVRMVLESELMIAAVTGKMHGWKVMLEHAGELGVSESVFEELIQAAEEQRETDDRGGDDDQE